MHCIDAMKESHGFSDLLKDAPGSGLPDYAIGHRLGILL